MLVGLAGQRSGQKAAMMHIVTRRSFVHKTFDAFAGIDEFERWYVDSVGAGVVVTDIRSQDQVDAIRRLGGKVYLVTLPGASPGALSVDGGAVDLRLAVDRVFFRENDAAHEREVVMAELRRIDAELTPLLKEIYGRAARTGRVMLVGFAGRKRSGKDTAAGHLVDRRGFVRRAFADPLKRTCQDLFDLSDDQVGGDAKDAVDPRYARSPRELMQFMGTEFVRNFACETLWVDKFERWYAGARAAGGARRVVVADVRFQNEVDAIHRLGGKVYLVTRPGRTDSPDSHASEDVGALAVDGEIVNDGTIEDLRAAVYSAVL